MGFVIVSCTHVRLALGLCAGAYARGRPKGGDVFDVASEALVRARYTRTDPSVTRTYPSVTRGPIRPLRGPIRPLHADLSVRYTRTYPSVTRVFSIEILAPSGWPTKARVQPHQAIRSLRLWLLSAQDLLRGALSSLVSKQTVVCSSPAQAAGVRRPCGQIMPSRSYSLVMTRARTSRAWLVP